MPKEEVLFDASAVLGGTILMASAISGAGPDTHDSTVSLTSLLPKVARQRDVFYARLMESVSGARAKRLEKHARTTQQPFGHVRQYLNFYLAQYGTQQVQRRQVAYLYARMAYSEAAREQASVIPCAAARFECEIQWRLAALRQMLDRGDVARAADLLKEVEDHLQRGIDCGAIVDPWNILGFQGQFPLFSSREDSVLDQRVEILLQLVEGMLEGYSRTLQESAARAQKPLEEQLSRGSRSLPSSGTASPPPPYRTCRPFLRRTTWNLRGASPRRWRNGAQPAKQPDTSLSGANTSASFSRPRLTPRLWKPCWTDAITSPLWGC